MERKHKVAGYERQTIPECEAIDPTEAVMTRAKMLVEEGTLSVLHWSLVVSGLMSERITPDQATILLDAFTDEIDDIPHVSADTPTAADAVRKDESTTLTLPDSPETVEHARTRRQVAVHVASITLMVAGLVPLAVETFDISPYEGVATNPNYTALTPIGLGLVAVAGIIRRRNSDR